MELSSAKSKNKAQRSKLNPQLSAFHFADFHAKLRKLSCGK